MGVDLDLSLDGGAKGGISTPKLQFTATPPPLIAVLSNTATAFTVPLVANQAMQITAINAPSGVSITAPTLPLDLASGASTSIVGTITDSILGQHNLILTVSGVQGGVTLHKNIVLHYVVADNTLFVTNSGAQIVNNHKTIINS